MSGFVDECQLNVRGGDGGAGSVSFRREAHVPKGGPDGGDGGKGGDIWLVADRNVASLLDFRDHPHRRAVSGKHGAGKKRHGSAGPDLEVRVPEGTVVLDDHGEVLADLVTEGDRWLAAEGGRGGRGNARFLSNKRRAPSFAEQGEPGEERWLALELKLMADVALVGFPNAGKSTLISRVSAAKPKIADYPFTTLEPHLGVVRMDERFEFVVADIPGLIEGASEGRGLGHKFLRHIERARVLLILCDLAPVDERTPAEQERVLLRELGDYRPELLERPRLVVGSKADALDRERAEDPAWSAWLAEHELVSAATGDAIKELVGRLAGEVRSARESEPTTEGFVIHRPIPEDVAVERDDDGSFRVLGRPALRAVALTDLTNPQALDEAQRRLDKLGVNRALVRAGVREGDTVHIGSFVFDFQTDDD
jgi:GTP-binding protein